MKERMAFYANLAQVLKGHRDKLGLNINTVAKMTGLSKGIIEEIERGQSIIEAYEFKQLMECYQKFEDADEKLT